MYTHKWWFLIIQNVNETLNCSWRMTTACRMLCAATYEEMKNWLQLHQQPQSKVMDYWRRTAKRRLSMIHSPRVPSLENILQQWPRYKDKGGFFLTSWFPHSTICGFGQGSSWPVHTLTWLISLTKIKGILKSFDGIPIWSQLLSGLLRSVCTSDLT